MPVAVSQEARLVLSAVAAARIGLTLPEALVERAAEVIR